MECNEDRDQWNVRSIGKVMCNEYREKCLKQRLWILLRSASLSPFYRVPQFMFGSEMRKNVCYNHDIIHYSTGMLAYKLNY